MVKDGGSAFPITYWVGSTNGPQPSDQSEGMTLRDYFAAKAMHSLLTTITELPDETWRLGVAKDAYMMADAMLEARK